MPDQASNDRTIAAANVFATTQWTVVLQSKDPDSPSAMEAISRLCQIYWGPLHAYARRVGISEHDAEDLAQEFFVRFCARNYLQNVGPEKGKFRSFLLACFKHFLSDQWDRARAQKRGGGAAPLSLDDMDLPELGNDQSAEKIYERRWAMTLLERVLARLESDYAGHGKESFFNALRIFLPGGEGGSTYAQAAEKAGMSEGAIKVAVHRLRNRYRELLREEVRATVQTEAEVDEELRHLLQVLA